MITWQRFVNQQRVNSGCRRTIGDIIEFTCYFLYQAVVNRQLFLHFASGSR